MGGYLRKYVLDPVGIANMTTWDSSLGNFGVIRKLINLAAYKSIFTGSPAVLDDEQLDQSGYISTFPIAAPGGAKDKTSQEAGGNSSLGYQLRSPPFGKMISIARTAWFKGEMSYNGGAGIMVSDTAGLIKWYLTFMSAPQKVGLSEKSLRQMLAPTNPQLGGEATTFAQGITVELARSNTSITKSNASSTPAASWPPRRVQYVGSTASTIATICMVPNKADFTKSDVSTLFMNLIPVIPQATNVTACTKRAADGKDYPLPRIMCDIQASALDSSAGNPAGSSTGQQSLLDYLGPITSFTRTKLDAIWF